MHVISLGVDCAMGGAIKDYLDLEADNSPFHGIWIYNQEEFPNIFSIGHTIAPLFRTRFDNWGSKKKGTRRDLPVSTDYPIEFTHKSVFWPRVRKLQSILDDEDYVIFTQMLRLYNYNGKRIEDAKRFQQNVSKFKRVMKEHYPHKKYEIKFFGMVSPDKKKRVSQMSLMKLFLEPFDDIKYGFPVYGRHKFDKNPGHKTTSFYGTGWEDAFKKAGL